MTDFLNDEKRASEFFSLFDARLESMKTDFALGGYMCSPVAIDTLRDLKIFFKKNISFPYVNHVVEKSSKRLSKSFLALFLFVDKEFRHDGRGHYILRSELYDDPKKEDEWFKYEKKFNELLEDFGKSYDDFFTTVKKTPSTVALNDVAVQGKSSLCSISLIAQTTEPMAGGIIFLVLDGHFNKPIKCVAEHHGHETYLTKLYHIASPWKLKLRYDGKLAENINNGLFKIVAVKKYMLAQRFAKPTLVKKSPENNFMLNSQIDIKVGIIAGDVPAHLRSLYKMK